MVRRGSAFTALYLVVCIAGACGGESHDRGSGTGGSHAAGTGGDGTTTGGTGALGGTFGAGATSGDSSLAGMNDLGGTPGSGAASGTGGTDSHGHGAGGENDAGAPGGEGGTPLHGEAGIGPSGSAGASEPAHGVCGNGIVESDEACDDGNRAAGDGCSRDCTIEHGFVCSNAKCDGNHCTVSVPATFRDFNGCTETGGHPDFQPGYNSPGAIQGLVERDLDADGKPVLSSTASTLNGFFHGADAFAEWFRDGPPSGGPIPGEIVLWDDGSGHGRYVNRFGAHGEQWQGNLTQSDYAPITYGGAAGGGCQACAPTATGACYDPCIPWNDDSYACCAEIPTNDIYDGTPLFFPIDTGPNLLVEPRSEATVPEQFGWVGFPREYAVAQSLGVMVPEATAWAPFPSKEHNFSFTTEVKYWFRYDAGRKYTFEVGGDDDLWFFINGHLAIDLGGWHTPLDGSATLEGGVLAVTAELTEYLGTPTVVHAELTAESLGLESGNVYPIAIFSAEREAESSTFKFAIGGIDATQSTCAPAP